MSTVPALSSGLSYQPTTSPSGSYLSTSQAAINETDTESAQASVSLSANLNGVSAATGTGQLTLAFARAVQGATEVDPDTGHLEITAGANAALVSTINSLLEQSGLTAAQASSATANLGNELTQGGPITLTANFLQSSQASGSVSSDYGPNASSVTSAVEATTRSSSIAIGIDLDTGELSVSLVAQNKATYISNGSTTGAGTLASPIGQFLQLPSATFGASNTASSDFGATLSNQSLADLASETLGGTPSVAGQTASQAGFGTSTAFSPLTENEVDTYASDIRLKLTLTQYSPDGQQLSPNQLGGAAQTVTFDSQVSGNDSYSSTTTQSTAVSSGSDYSGGESLQQLFAELNQVTLLGNKETTAFLQSLPNAAGSAKAGGATGQPGTASGTAPSSLAPAESSAAAKAIAKVATIVLGATQTTSLQRLDADGYGATLYKRPDGSAGTISARATRTTA
jgi:hypothetical protein